MALAPGSDMWQAGFYSKCPNCGKKGFYQPRALISKNIGGRVHIIYYNKTCRYCKFVENGSRIKSKKTVER